MVTRGRAVRRFDVPATFACLGSLLLWSLGPNFIKYLTGHVDFWTQNVLRYTVACMFWLPFLLFGLRTKRIEASVWRRALLPSGANIAFQSLWAAAFYYVDPAFMVLLNKSSVIWIAGFSLIFFADERPLARSRYFWAGLILSMVGVIGVIYFKQDFAAYGTRTGVIIGLVTSLMWAAYTLSVKVALRDIDSRTGFSVISIYTVIGLFALGLMFGRLSDCLRMPPWPWACVVISAVASIALSHVFYYSAIKRIGATVPALVILAQPFAVFAISHIVFGEILTGFQLFFGLVLLAGAACAIWAQQHLNRDP
jgi:drug/metabolite transporter (DMT)-like permease